MYAAEYRIILNTDNEAEADRRAEHIAAAIDRALREVEAEWVSSDTYTY